VGVQIPHFYNTHINRIWWALNSDSFLSLNDSVIYFQDAEHKEEVLNLLKLADQNQELVNAHFDTLGQMPMGRYFEQLLIFILERDQRYDLLAHNVQIIEDKITRGELDLILYDRKNKEHLHWEVALKFYLQVGETGDHHNFLGPSKRDFLGRKMKKLRQNQMPLSRHPQIREKYGSLKSGLFLKGQLFYPFKKDIVQPHQANTAASSFEYLSIKDFKNQAWPEEATFKILKKPDWIGPKDLSPESELFNAKEVLEQLHQEMERIDRPQLVALFKKQDARYLEQERYFVTSENWPLPIQEAKL